MNYADPDNRDLIAEAYDEWKEMTEDVIFFDTGACLLGGHIGDANKQTFSATSSRFVDWGSRIPTLEQEFTTRTND